MCLRAMAEHERAISRVTVLTKQIREALERCPVSVEYQSLMFKGDGAHLLDANGRLMTHFAQALGLYGWDDELAAGALRCGGEFECEHCAAAWDLVADRRRARQDLGKAKRKVRYYGKKAAEYVDKVMAEAEKDS